MPESDTRGTARSTHAPGGPAPSAYRAPLPTAPSPVRWDASEEAG